jgi:hypothetical protein
MKTAFELIQRIDAMTSEYGRALLIIGFPRKSRVVGMEFPKARMRRLEELLSKGGVPIAFVSSRRVRGKLHFYYLLVDDLRGEVWAEVFTIVFVDHLARSVEGEIPTNIGIEKIQRLLSREKTHRER